MQIARGRQDGGESSKRDGTFTGTVYLDPVLPSADSNSVNDVFFAPGSRTYWHFHEFGQILKVTSGEGLVCSAGGAPRVIRAGDTVWVPAGERHWHGGSASTCLAHTAISLGQTTWLDEVTEDEYAVSPDGG